MTRTDAAGLDGLEHRSSWLNGRSVLVTGHTGFKGSWLALWLHRLGAQVTGVALDPPTTPSHFETAQVGRLLKEDVRGDIRDGSLMAELVRSSEADVVFHLAAQPIVGAGVREPRETFEVNVVGTASVLDAVRAAGRAMAVVVVTSDKCYRNDGQVWGFRERDPLGGHDPYSASKAGTELVVDAYRSSYFPPDRLADHGVHLASARAGNVIGGGDWADDRIVPDAVRALSSGQHLVVRHPRSTRPWQHVLEPLWGYLQLATRLLEGDEPARWADAWNFGPLPSEGATVAELADAVVDAWGGGQWVSPASAERDVEAATLRIAPDKAISYLGWRPRWSFEEAIRRTITWYRHYYEGGGDSMRDASLADIDAYESSFARRKS